MTDPTRIILACDESGAKGYADRDEQYPGEIGVFAGFLMPEEWLDEKSPPLQALIPKYTSPGGKLHIADLTPSSRRRCARTFMRLFVTADCRVSGTRYTSQASIIGIRSKSS